MFAFFLNSFLLGTGLAMDAFSVSVANALHEPGMSGRRMCVIAGVYAFFQAFMPMTGWTLVHFAAVRFQAFRRWIPWIGGLLLLWIGGKMVWESVGADKDAFVPALDVPTLLIQGVATSIDALSAGFAFADYGVGQAFLASGIIAAVTFGICLTGLLTGRHLGQWLSRRAGLCGGLILIGIGIENLLRGIL